MSRTLLLILFLALCGCSVLAASQLDERYGSANPARYDHPNTTGSIDYWQDINPLLEQRCVVCHACYDAPCQLKLGAWEGITRGANKDFVYNGERLLAAAPTRLFEDAHTTAQWRDKGFFSVLNERADTPQANRDASVMAQMLLLKQQHPLPKEKRLPDSFDLRLTRDQQCSNIEEFPAFRRDYPLWGMPYALPGLSPQEHQRLLQWIEQGAPYTPRNLLNADLQQQIDQWETFFNQDSLKAQLMSRYMYEHLFLAHLYFPGDGRPLFFNLVRSRTAPGQRVDRISTLRPYDDPGVKRVYYRLIPVPESIVAKTHMPYRLDAQRLQRWQQLFLQPEYSVSTLPSYDPATASNPFATFEQLPAVARYRFMLEEAQYTIMGFIKGPVCRGQLALNVINDHFWVAFTDPDIVPAHGQSEYLGSVLKDTPLPGEAQSTTSPLRWLAYAKEEKAYLKAKSKLMAKQLNHKIPLDMNLIWDGDGHNRNAALTIFRHLDSATVEQGLLGERPQTMWVVTYPLLERIHYLLVAGYDVYGNVGHQLNSRIYMDFLRMEGEFNFLTLLPKDQRDKVRNQWYRGSVNPVKEYVYSRGNTFSGETDERYATTDYLTELYGKFNQRLAPVLNRQHDLQHGFDDDATRKAFALINSVKGTAASLLPQTLFIEVTDSNNAQRHYYTLLHHNAYTNISEIFGEADRRLPQEDAVLISYGLIGAYPSALLRVDRKRLQDFAEQVQELRSEKDYAYLLDQFGVRRTDPLFWQYSDRLHQWYLTHNPIDGGILDYNRLENR